MRTHKAFSAAAAALALVTAAGCCGTNGDCPPVAPAPAQTVVVAAPAPVAVVAPAAVKAAYRPNRWHLRRRCYQPEAHAVSHCCLCNQTVAAAPAVVAAPQVVVKAEPGVLVVQPAKKDAAGRTVTVLQRGRKGRILCREGNIAVVRPGVTVAAVPAPAVVSEPAFVEPVVVAEPAVVEPVAAVPAEPVVEEPSWAKYLAPEQPAVVASAPAPLAAEPTAQFVEPALVPAEPFVVAAPAPVYAGQQPIVIQPIIQPVVQTGQEVLSGQVQVPVAAPAAPVAFTTQPLVTFQPVSYGQALPAGVPPVMTGSMFTTNPLVCGPGQNCFTLSENQLQGGPQVLTPTAAAPLMPVQVTVASAAPVAAAPLAMPPAAAQDKYAPAAAAPARQAERPEVSMPAPLGRTTTPPVAGTDEIENALDVMMGNTPVLK